MLTFCYHFTRSSLVFRINKNIDLIVYQLLSWIVNTLMCAYAHLYGLQCFFNVHECMCVWVEGWGCSRPIDSWMDEIKTSTWEWALGSWWGRSIEMHWCGINPPFSLSSTRPFLPQRAPPCVWRVSVTTPNLAFCTAIPNHFMRAHSYFVQYLLLLISLRYPLPSKKHLDILHRVVMSEVPPRYKLWDIKMEEEMDPFLKHNMQHTVKILYNHYLTFSFKVI